MVIQNRSWNILQRSTVFVSTVYREGFGLPIEAMACGHWL